MQSRRKFILGSVISILVSPYLKLLPPSSVTEGIFVSPPVFPNITGVSALEFQRRLAKTLHHCMTAPMSILEQEEKERDAA